MILVDDTEMEFVDGKSIEALLKELDPTMPMAVVKVNGEYLSKREWDRVIVDEDEIRIVYMIAGG